MNDSILRIIRLVVFASWPFLATFWAVQSFRLYRQDLTPAMTARQAPAIEADTVSTTSASAVRAEPANAEREPVVLPARTAPAEAPKPLESFPAQEP